MPVKAKELGHKQVQSLAKKGKDGLYPVGGEAGLSLQVKAPANTSWILRTVINGKRRYIGLGSYPTIPLSKAREVARELKQRIKLEGYDPIVERKQQKSVAEKEQAKLVTFKERAAEYVEKRSTEFKSEQQVRKLTAIMENYAYPILKNMLIRDIDLNTIRKVLTQSTVVKRRNPETGEMEKEKTTLWQGKNETANRLRIYLTHIFDAAIASGIYTELNPARWKGGLETILPAPQKVSKTQHRRAISVDEMPEFWAKLLQEDYTSARILQFGILTAARSNEMRGAMWSEIDFKEKVWRLPAERMKGIGGKERPHDVPLSDAALEVLAAMPRENEYIFPNPKGAPYSSTQILNVGKKLGYDATVHGFRSTFKDWASQHKKYKHKEYSDHLSEVALSHVVGDSTRNAYARDPLIEERRPMMDEWAEYCQRRLNNVVKMQGAK